MTIHQAFNKVEAIIAETQMKGVDSIDIREPYKGCRFGEGVTLYYVEAEGSGFRLKRVGPSSNPYPTDNPKCVGYGDNLIVVVVYDSFNNKKKVFK